MMGKSFTVSIFQKRKLRLSEGRGLAHFPRQSLDLNSHPLVPPPWPGDPAVQEKGLTPHTLAAGARFTGRE